MTAAPGVGEGGAARAWFERALVLGDWLAEAHGCRITRYDPVPNLHSYGWVQAARVPRAAWRALREAGWHPAWATDKLWTWSGRCRSTLPAPGVPAALYRPRASVVPFPWVLDGVEAWERLDAVVERVTPALARIEIAVADPRAPGPRRVAADRNGDYRLGQHQHVVIRPEPRGEDPRIGAAERARAPEADAP